MIAREDFSTELRNRTGRTNSWGMFPGKHTFQFSEMVNRTYISGGRNTFTLPWSTLETAPKLMCGVTCCAIIWSDPLFFAEATAGKLCLSTVTGSAACRVLPVRQRTITTGVGLCAHLWITARDSPCWSQFFGRQITGYHSLSVFRLGTAYLTPVADINDLKLLFQQLTYTCCSIQPPPTRNWVEQNSNCCWNIDAAWISLGHCKCDKWCPCRLCVTFFFLWRYSPNLGLGLPPWNSPFHFGFLDLRQSVGLLGRWSDRLKACTQTQKNAHTRTLHIHALSQIRTHDPGFRAREDSACLRPLGYRDRRV
jgi:hypothetical protein